MEALSVTMDGYQQYSRKLDGTVALNNEEIRQVRSSALCSSTVTHLLYFIVVVWTCVSVCLGGGGVIR